VSSIETAKGTIELRAPSAEEVEAVASRWPFGLVKVEEAYELPFSDPVGAMAGLYLPQVPLETAVEASPVVSRGRAALARGLGKLALSSEPVEGLLLASAVLRQEGEAWVPGLSFFAVPEPGAAPSSGTAAALEEDLEPGSGALLDRGLDALAAARRGLPPVRGVKVVGAPYMGARHLDFLVVGSQLYCLHQAPSESDPVWESLAKVKVKEVLHLPLAGVEAGASVAPRAVSPPDVSDVAPRLAEVAAPLVEDPTPRPGSPQESPADVVRVPHLGLTPRGARRVYRFLWHLAACDGEVHESELSILLAYRERLGIEASDAAVLEDEGRRGRHLTIGKRSVERALLLDALLDVAAADGRLDRAEEKRLVALGNLLKISRSEIRVAIQERFAHQGAEFLLMQSAVCPVTPEEPTYRGVRRIYRVLWNLAACDGHVARGEVQLLEAFRVRHGIPREEARSLEREGRAGRALQVSQSETERVVLANELIELAAVDGEISLAERRRILKLGGLLRMDRAELEARLHVRSQQLAAASSLATTDPGALDPPRSASTPSLHIGSLAHTSRPDNVAYQPQAEGPRGGTLVILGLPTEVVVSFDLGSVQLGGGDEGGLGLREIPPGVHRVALSGEEGEREVSFWLRITEGEVQVLELQGLSLAAAAPRELTHYLAKLQQGKLERELTAVRADPSWASITAPLREAGAFPPRLYPVSHVEPKRRMEEVWLELHRGESEELLAELAYAFLLGLFGEGPPGAEGPLARWSSLVQGIYHCGDELPLQNPAFFAELVDLLIAQQRLLPREQLAGNTPAGSGAHYLSEDLEETGNPTLREAARRWATFCGGYHPGAPEPSKRPQRLLAPQRSAASKVHAASLSKATRALEEEQERFGERAASLIPLLAHVGQLQELSNDLFAAIATQQRLLALGAANEVPTDLLATGLERMSRLQREVGRGREADRLEREAKALRL
jgi:uncharacterized tellurite resistance protein B-like protein